MAPSRAVSAQPQSIGSTLQSLWRTYLDDTPPRLQLCDAFLVYLMLSGALLMVYVFLVTAYPFNAFLAAFSSTVGLFVLIVSLRMQVNPTNKLEFLATSPERCAAPDSLMLGKVEAAHSAFAEFCFASVVLIAFVTNYLG